MKPVLQALLLADRVYTDVSGKSVIAGTFNRLFLMTGVPSRKKVRQPDGSTRTMVLAGGDPGCPTLYLSLTDVVDGTDITIQVVNISKNKVITGQNVRLEPKDRLATVEVVLPLPPIRSLFPAVGVYSIDAVWEGEILGFHRIDVVPFTLPEHDKEEKA